MSRPVTLPSAVLRAAAARIRELAQDASVLSPPPWSVSLEGDPEIPYVLDANGQVVAASYLAQVHHIAVWDPRTAELAAVVLESTAGNMDRLAITDPAVAGPVFILAQAFLLDAGLPAEGH